MNTPLCMICVCLRHLSSFPQVYKATGDFTAAKEMYLHYSSVSDERVPHFLSARTIVLARKQPRKMFVQCNTTISGEHWCSKYECPGLPPPSMCMYWAFKTMLKYSIFGILTPSFLINGPLSFVIKNRCFSFFVYYFQLTNLRFCDKIGTFLRNSGSDQCANS